eukprot:jgi/Psemu1/307708/fgenesh1_kg.348_\
MNERTNERTNDRDLRNSDGGNGPAKDTLRALQPILPNEGIIATTVQYGYGTDIAIHRPISTAIMVLPSWYHFLSTVIPAFVDRSL